MTNLDDTQITLPMAFLEALSNAESVEDVLSLTSRWLPELVSAARGSCAYVDGDRVVGRAFWADGRPDPADVSASPRSANSLRATVMDTGKCLTIDAEKMATSPATVVRSLYDEGLRSMLFVPMMHGGRAVGLITVGTEDPQGFPKSDNRKLKLIGKCAAAQLILMTELRKIGRQAETDPLTGLANRKRLMRVLDRGGAELSRADESGNVLGLLQIDLDYFKSVNDTYGHAAGDAVLEEATRIMQAAVTPKDLVARIGGDEFVVVARTEPSGRKLMELAEDLVAALSRPMEIEGRQIQIGASIGLAMARRPDITATRLLANADAALYQVKRAGRGGVRAFDAEMRQASLRRAALLDDLRSNRVERAFVPYFQPLVSLSSGHFVGFETLARWDHAEFGLLDPADFFDLAHEAGVTADVDRIVRRKGLEALRDMRKAGWAVPRVSFNVANATIDDPGFARLLQAEVDSFGLASSDLVIEVHQRDLAALGHDAASQVVMSLQAAGFAVELDDFGSGLACMAMLAQTPVSAVKLDPSLVALLPNARAETVLAGVIDLAHRLDVNVIAEGIETAEQFLRLRQLGCDHGQGYGISHPLPYAALLTFMDGYGKAPVDLAQQALGKTA